MRRQTPEVVALAKERWNVDTPVEPVHFLDELMGVSQTI